ncbi:hypothetical protein L210DRAFT_935195 [Boletus edulis BED1]|uniref:Uncharacterized protein n=1 Tax=Boletus edulis BED1 TaxID=1328754 RepID=A0AAD4G8D6_BOLED|nr:hypothetical protein L210DRAFT_935195 [Boletus edulis BED1]
MPEDSRSDDSTSRTSVQLLRIIALLEEIQLNDGRNLLFAIEDEARTRRSSASRSGNECAILVIASIEIQVDRSKTGSSSTISSAVTSASPLTSPHGPVSPSPRTPQTGTVHSLFGPRARSPSTSSDAMPSTVSTPQPLIMPQPPQPLRSTLLSPSDHSTIWRHTYRGIIFPVPSQNTTAKPPFYCVTKGTTIGIFETWWIVLYTVTQKVNHHIRTEAASYVTGIKRAVHCKVDSIDEAVRLFETTADRNGVEILYQ